MHIEQRLSGDFDEDMIEIHENQTMRKNLGSFCGPMYQDQWLKDTL